MTESDKATLATLGRMIVADRVSVAKALEAAYLLGELEGQLKVARIAEKSMSKINDYANAMVKRDQLERHEGRDEHDMNTRSEPLRSNR